MLKYSKRFCSSIPFTIFEYQNLKNNIMLKARLIKMPKNIEDKEVKTIFVNNVGKVLTVVKLNSNGKRAVVRMESGLVRKPYTLNEKEMSYKDITVKSKWLSEFKDEPIIIRQFTGRTTRPSCIGIPDLSIKFDPSLLTELDKISKAFLKSNTLRFNDGGVLRGRNDLNNIKFMSALEHNSLAWLSQCWDVTPVARKISHHESKEFLLRKDNLAFDIKKTITFAGAFQGLDVAKHIVILVPCHKDNQQYKISFDKPLLCGSFHYENGNVVKYRVYDEAENIEFDVDRSQVKFVPMVFAGQETEIGKDLLKFYRDGVRLEISYTYNSCARGFTLKTFSRKLFYTSTGSYKNFKARD